MCVCTHSHIINIYHNIAHYHENTIITKTSIAEKLIKYTTIFMKWTKMLTVKLIIQTHIPQPEKKVAINHSVKQLLCKSIFVQKTNQKRYMPRGDGRITDDLHWLALFFWLCGFSNSNMNYCLTELIVGKRKNDVKVTLTIYFGGISRFGFSLVLKGKCVSFVISPKTPDSICVRVNEGHSNQKDREWRTVNIHEGTAVG